jgi:hypothetical protein
LTTVQGFAQFEMPKGSKQKGLVGFIATSSSEFRLGYFPYNKVRQINTLASSVANINWFIANNMSLGIANTISLNRTALRYKS